MERSDLNPFNEELLAKIVKCYKGDDLEIMSRFVKSLSENNELNNYFERNQDLNLNSSDELISIIKNVISAIDRSDSFVMSDEFLPQGNDLFAHNLVEILNDEDFQEHDKHEIFEFIGKSLSTEFMKNPPEDDPENKYVDKINLQLNLGKRQTKPFLNQLKPKYPFEMMLTLFIESNRKGYLDHPKGIDNYINRWIYNAFTYDSSGIEGSIGKLNWCASGRKFSYFLSGLKWDFTIDSLLANSNGGRVKGGIMTFEEWVRNNFIYKGKELISSDVKFKSIVSQIKKDNSTKCCKKIRLSDGKISVKIL